MAGATGGTNSRGGVGAIDAASSSGGGAVESVNGATGVVLFPLQQRDYFADQLIVPNSDWAIPAVAPTDQDNTRPLRSIVGYPASPEQGRGISECPPVGAAFLVIRRCYKAATAPGGARTAGAKLYWTRAPYNAAVPAFLSMVLADYAIPTNTNPQYIEDLIQLSDLTGLVAEQEAYYELTRIAPTAGTDLTGNLNLSSVRFTWWSASPE
jgi:hypothetical protein